MIGRERGWPPLSREAFEQMAGPDGAYYVGSPETVARKIVRHQKALGAARFDLKYAVGTLSHSAMMRSIELYGTEVRRLVRTCSPTDPARSSSSSLPRARAGTRCVHGLSRRRGRR